MNRFGINEDANDFDDIRENMRRMISMFRALAASPDVIFEENSFRVRQPAAPFGVSGPTTSGSEKHPFKMRVDSDQKLWIQDGMVFLPQVTPDSASAQVLTWFSVDTEIGTNPSSNNLENHPEGYDAGFIQLATSTTYGVFIEIEDDSPTTKSAGNTTATSVNKAITTSWYDEIMIGPDPGATVKIVTSTTYTSRGSEALMAAANAGKQYIFIGRVEIDGSDNVTIAQHLKSDVYAAHWILPTSFEPSSDGGNLLAKDATDKNRLLLKLGTDGGAGGNNLITVTNGGLYLGDEQVVTSLTGGTDISVTDDGGGSWTIDYTGT